MPLGCRAHSSDKCQQHLEAAHTHTPTHPTHTPHTPSCLLFIFEMPGLLIIYLNEVSNGHWLTKKIRARTYLFILPPAALFSKSYHSPAVRRNQEFWQWAGVSLSGKQSNFNSDGKFWCSSLEADASWCRAPTAVQSCASLMLYPCVTTAFLGIMPATGVWEQAGSCSHHQDWLGRPSVCSGTVAIHIASLQNVFLHKYLQKSIGWLGMFAGHFLLCSSKGWSGGWLVGWGSFTPCWPPQHRAQELQWWPWV